ncbi:hypothetical protein, partial [Escherichia coli]|uniref:hypothetical protein n=1 Tax=Escherichia coli TaxID=562 RepID=UPI0019600820
QAGSDWHLIRGEARERQRHDMMKTPVGLVTVTLSAAILLAASLLIVTGTQGEDRAHPPQVTTPAAKPAQHR